MERAWRLRKGSEFDTAYAKGTVTSGPLLVVRVLANDVGHPRWGYAVGKRIAKSAVVRNHHRRRLREAATAAGNAGGWDIIVTARANALSAPYAEVAAALVRQLKRATKPKAAPQVTPPATEPEPGP